jgi:multidrug efflux pump subunit AcrB
LRGLAHKFRGGDLPRFVIPWLEGGPPTKKIFAVLVLLLAGWYLYGKIKERATPEKIRQYAPVKYTASLQADLKKAEEVQKKAADKIDEGSRELDKGLKDAQ